MKFKKLMTAAAGLMMALSLAACSGGGAGGSNEGRLLSSRGSVIAEPRTNQLFVSDIPSRLEQIQDMITKLDVPVRQVLIEARIVEATDTFGKSLGIKLSVDDFGTGYSSLTYLKRFAVDKLKIDQSFVRDLVTDPDDAAIVRAIIQMAHSLKLKTIAEGVETEELANLLRIFHCDEIQGYWLARPMPAEQMEVFLRERASDQFA